MDAIKYKSGEIVLLGDAVKIKRLLRRPIKGVVTKVYDPDKDSPPRGDNDYGIGIELDDGSYLWGIPDKTTFLIGRKRKS